MALKNSKKRKSAADCNVCMYAVYLEKEDAGEDNISIILYKHESLSELKFKVLRFFSLGESYAFKL